MDGKEYREKFGDALAKEWFVRAKDEFTFKRALTVINGKTKRLERKMVMLITVSTTINLAINLGVMIICQRGRYQ